MIKSIIETGNPERNQMNTLTGHQVAKVVNTKLEDAGFATIPPQMVYNYMKSGMIPVTYVEGKKRITVEDAKAWMAKFIEGKRSVSNTMAELLKQFDDVEEVEALDEESDLYRAEDDFEDELSE
jgi:hypothetical protein